MDICVTKSFTLSVHPCLFFYGNVTNCLFNFQAHVEYETAKRHYAHVDCPGHADYVKVRFTFGKISPINVLFMI